MLQFGLNRQILAIVLGACVLGALIASFLVLSLQRFQCIEHTQRTNQQLLRVIDANLQSSLHVENHDAITQLIRTIPAQTNVESLRLLDGDGTVWSSSNPAEVGQPWNDRLTAAWAESAEGEASFIHQTQIHQNHEDAVTLSPIFNEAACVRCHGSEPVVLGQLMITTPLSSLEYRITEGLWRIFLSIAITFVLLVMVLTFFLQRLVSHPVAELSRGVSAIAGGNLDRELTMHNRNELGALAHSFDQMRRQLKASITVMERQNQELWLLNHLDIQISASLNVERILQTVAEGAYRLLKSDAAMVGVYSEGENTVRFKVVAGHCLLDLQGMALPVQEGILAWPTMVDLRDAKGLAGEAQARLVSAGVVSMLTVPVHQQDRLLGSITVLACHPQHFGEEETRLLVRLAEQMVTAIENARLYEQVRHVAALEERERLAREMHDRLAQTLGYLNIKVTLIEEMLSQAQTDAVRTGLQELKEVLREGYIDVREAIFNLRTVVASPSDFVSTLQSYLADYRLHYGLQTHLQLEYPTPVPLPSDAHIQLLRIVQEALTNVRKHAQASQVQIRLSQDDGRLTISIEDDGQGFDPNQVGEDSRVYCGLHIMRERAESVGGTLHITSSPGLGTQIHVQIPYATDTPPVAHTPS